MNVFKKLDPRIRHILKIIGFVIIALFALSFIVVIFCLSWTNSLTLAPLPSSDMYNSYSSYSTEPSNVREAGISRDYVGVSGKSTSPSSVPTPGGHVSVGGDAEDYESTSYTVSIETRKLSDTCSVISGLKPLGYVVFETANEGDRLCNYLFKVEHAYAPSVLETLKLLNPKSLNENKHTLKRTLSDYASEEDILKKRLASIDATLEDATTAYGELTSLAGKTGDAKSLSEVIKSRIEIIERLTNERLNVSASLDRLTRSKAESLDRLEYTYFNVSVYKNTYFDGEYFTDSWKSALKNFFESVSLTLQRLTLGFLEFLLLLLPFVLYGIVLILVAKYGVRFVRYVWKR